MKNVLITGVAGFIGSNLAQRFIDENWQVFGVDDLSSGYEENIPNKVHFLKADLSKKKTIKLLPSNCDLILHLAGQSSGEVSFDDPILDLRKNTFSTLNLIQYGIGRNVNKIIYASSMSVYGEVPDKPIKEEQTCFPLSCYGVGKLTSENYLRIYQNKIPYVALRMFNVYGPGQDMKNMRQGMVSIFVSQALNLEKIQVKGSLNRFRDFIYIDDVVDIWWKISNQINIKNDIFNLGTGNKTKVSEVIGVIEKNLPNVSHYVNDSTPGDQSGIFADIKKLKHEIDYHNFISIKDGLENFLKYLREK